MLQRIKVVKDLLLLKLDSILSQLESVLQQLKAVSRSIQAATHTSVEDSNALLKSAIHLVEVQQQQNQFQSHLIHQLKILKQQQEQIDQKIHSLDGRIHALDRNLVLAGHATEAMDDLKDNFAAVNEQLQALKHQNLSILYYVSTKELVSKSLIEQSKPVVESHNEAMEVGKVEENLAELRLSQSFASEDLAKLKLFQSLGFSATCIYDIGASNGCWTKAIAQAFPNAEFHLFEPLADAFEPYQRGLAEITQSQIECRIHSFALGEVCKVDEIGVTVDPSGSSLLVEHTSEYFPSSVHVQVLTLDEAITRFSLPFPQLIKMDTQGYELKILQGASKALEHVELIILESWLSRGYGAETPLLFEIAAWLAERKFFLLDFSGVYRDDKGILIAQDCIFAKEPSLFLSDQYIREFVTTKIDL